MPASGDIILPGTFTSLGSPTWATFTPTWASSGGGQSLGNGTLTGRWAQSGKIVFFRIQLTFGSTTARGSGRYSFGGLPVSRAVTPQAVSSYVEGTARYGGAAQVDGSGVFSINVGATEVTATTPFTWAAGNLLVVQGSYESV
jgi:hypothetical protein